MAYPLTHQEYAPMYMKDLWLRPGVPFAPLSFQTPVSFGISTVARTTAARRNISDRDEVYTGRVFAEGAFKRVYEGVYQSGPRKGQKSVCKVFKDRAVYAKSFFDHELAVVDKAMEIIEKFNDEGIIDELIYLNEPEIWTFNSGDWSGQSLCEPMIRDFRKFNSNTGWHAPSTAHWPLLMQALSHFSYHATGGAYLLCDLQGGFFRDGVVLTDPVVMSCNKRFGPSDLGAEGISTFFSAHVCNRYCCHHWQKPRDRTAYFNVQQGTSMVAPRQPRAAVPPPALPPPMPVAAAEEGGKQPQAPAVQRGSGLLPMRASVAEENGKQASVAAEGANTQPVAADAEKKTPVVKVENGAPPLLAVKEEYDVPPMPMAKEEIGAQPLPAVKELGVQPTPIIREMPIIKEEEEFGMPPGRAVKEEAGMGATPSCKDGVAGDGFV